MSVPAFIDIDETDQILELRTALQEKGAEIQVQGAEELIADLKDVLRASEVLWADGVAEADIEAIFNSIISLLVVVPAEKSESLVVIFTEKLSRLTEKGDRRSTVRMRLLNNLFNGLDDRSTLRYIVYSAMVKLAGQADLINHLNPNLDEVKNWLKVWDVTVPKAQAMYRSLHDALAEAKQGDKAFRIMLELLGTYTEDNASQARDDAHKCIVAAIGDPNTFLMDHLLTLKPVMFLEGELIHNLLTIFVSGRLNSYNAFYSTNKDFIGSLGLSHEANQHKMRILTFMTMGETQKEISFDTIEKELEIPTEEVESFIIELVRTKQVQAKMDQMARKIIINSVTHRTFGTKQQWQMLRESLSQWQANLSLVMNSLAQLPG